MESVINSATCFQKPEVVVQPFGCKIPGIYCLALKLHALMLTFIDSRTNGSQTIGHQGILVPDKWVPDKWVPDKWAQGQMGPRQMGPGQMGLGQMGLVQLVSG